MQIDFINSGLVIPELVFQKTSTDVLGKETLTAIIEDSIKILLPSILIPSTSSHLLFHAGVGLILSSVTIVYRIARKTCKIALVVYDKQNNTFVYLNSNKNLNTASTSSTSQPLVATPVIS